MPGRFGQPAGFGGGFTQPTRGEFQPGTEEGVIDPNFGRQYVCLSKPSSVTLAAFTKPNSVRHFVATDPTSATHFAATKPQSNVNCT